MIATELARLAPYADLPIAVSYFWYDLYLVLGETAPIGRIPAACGIDVISPDPDATGGITIRSLEQIDAVSEAQVTIAPDFVAEQTAAQEASDHFHALPAVRDGGYKVHSPAMAQALDLESALSTQWAMPQLVDAVIADANGEGRRLD